ncbi:MAG: S24 family peptidase [Moraxella sp.]|uniref:LexA family protein n=1 Tax=Moraxella sp. TaxID=479 RepID=UPI0026DCB27E|nr:S24 family peptidase [Moraxella sp.]MDO4450035.1 S24 family peptidase [Moraxella sp.]
MQTIADRIRQQMTEHDISQADIHRATGAGKATISSWLDGKTEPSSKYIASLADALKCNMEWLVVGKNNTHAIDKTKQAIGNIRPAMTKSRKEVRYAPLLARVPAGEFKNTGDLTHDTYISYDQERASDDCYWLEVYGDSMEPDFNKGDLILVDAGRQARAGDYVVANLDDGDSTFKRYKACHDDNDGDYVQLIALNSFYTPIDSRKVQFHVAGVVIEHRRTLK